MRKMLALLAVGAIALVMPFAGLANDVPDGADCDAGATGAYTTGQQDRSAICLNAGGFTVFYLGGEAQPEEAENQDGFQGLCGSVTVAGQTQGSGHSGGTGGGGPGDWSWTHTHPGPDGILGTADDIQHLHDCE